MAPTTAAQEEFNTLFSSTTLSNRTHPDDAAAHSSDHSDQEHDGEEAPPAPRGYDKDSSDEENSTLNDYSNKMKSAYYIPKARSEANTGPKGVIADAQAFEQAKKQHRFSFARQKNLSPAVPTATITAVNQAYHGDDFEKSSEDELEDGFMARWRQRRLQELTDKRFGRNGNNGSGRRTWGSLTKVDAEGYLDAIEQVSADTVVVVFIYDHASEVSVLVEDCVRQIAKLHNTTRFVKLHYVEAEMEVAGVPALLAYRGGDKFAGLVPIMDEIPDEEELSAITLGAVMRRHQILH